MNQKFILINPIGYAAVLLIIISLGMAIWRNNSKNTLQPVATDRCVRVQRYENPPVFDLAMTHIIDNTNAYLVKTYALPDSKGSTIDGLYESNVGQNPYTNNATVDFALVLNHYIKLVQNCLDIRLATPGTLDPGSEAAFITNSSNSNDLLIEFQPWYASGDSEIREDILAHEIYHATMYNLRKQYGIEQSYTSCLGEETVAFTTQLYYMSTMDPAQKARLGQALDRPTTTEAQTLRTLLEYSRTPNWQSFVTTIATTIYNSPGYQMQCRVYPDNGTNPPGILR